MKSYYSIDEAAECTGIGRNTLRKLIEWKKLPVLKVGRKLLIRADTIETFMELNEGNTSAMNLILRSSMRTIAELKANSALEEAIDATKHAEEIKELPALKELKDGLTDLGIA